MNFNTPKSLVFWKAAIGCLLHGFTHNNHASDDYSTRPGHSGADFSNCIRLRCTQYDPSVDVS